MGDLVMFRPALSTATPRAKAALRLEGAAILFFTGVRYQRAEPLASTSATQPPPAGGLNGAGRGKRKRRA
jgi:threonine/homoserine/homoserine lactone efflux protein